ncbi:putative 2-dehydropantoate 2-reductase [Neorhodopirellula pilleata]|uniref:putative 2-dehydropantoate 2-reductase n=1 Tax=Neorhodopirellula pilleata TaxID=2714738 RepID=UPI001E4148FD|nr:putative 2-dehydropantoate 2-reductase [Neorhodopirellula pilleata]
MRYGIIGSGAVGGLYGGLLAHGGHEVHFLLNSDFEHVQRHGLRVDSPKGDFVLESPAIYQNVREMPRCDVVILAMKSTRNHLLGELLPPVISPGGVVLNLQNGLDVEADCVDALTGVDYVGVMGGCCFLCSNKIGPGHIRHLDYGRIIFGAYQASGGNDDGESRRGEIGRQIVADMTTSKIDAKWTDDLAAARWRKLMWNIPFNGLSVVLNASTDAIMGSAPAKALSDRLIREVHAGAAACGVTVDPESIRQTMEHTETMVPYDSSMRLDFLAGRPMEVAAIFANPLAAVARAESSEKSEALGTPATMPSVAMLCQELQFLDSQPRGTSKTSD